MDDYSVLRLKSLRITVSFGLRNGRVGIGCNSGIEKEDPGIDNGRRPGPQRQHFASPQQWQVEEVRLLS